MIVLNDINLKEYLELEDKSEYNFAIKYAYVYTLPTDTLNIGDVMDLSFGFVKDYQYRFSQGLTFEDQYELVKEVTSVDLGKCKLTDYYKGLNYLHKGIEDITEAEQMMLSYNPSGKEISSGIDEFAKYGVYSQIRKLAGGDITKIHQVRELKYSECFTELLYQHDEYVFQSKMNKK